MNKIDELINEWELQGMFSTPKIANQARAQIKDLVQQVVSEQKEKDAEIVKPELIETESISGFDKQIICEIIQSAIREQ